MKCSVTEEKLMPQRAHEYDGGIDLKAAHDVCIRPGQAEIIDTGFAIALPKGFLGLLLSRSGHGKPTVRVSLSNCVGLIDCGYTDTIKVVLENKGSEEFRVKKYERIAQLAIVPCLVGYDLDLVEHGTLESFSERGLNGFGSSGVD